MSGRLLRLLVVGLAEAACLVGCIWGEKELHYLGDGGPEYYKGLATKIDYAHVHEPIPDEVQMTDKPHTILDRGQFEVRDITLDEAIQIALSNNSVIRSSAQFLSSNNVILANPNVAPSQYDPAIQETGVLFGRLGVEAALAAFDAQFSTSMIWGRNETPQNNVFFGSGVTPGGTLVQETGTFRSELSKPFGTGGQLTLQHNWNYLGLNAPGQLFPSSYTGSLRAQYRHPLLAGSGAEFTRIAGPIPANFRSITGVSQGVLIARINNDISLADFEANIRNLLKDVEDLYWDLNLKYRLYDTTITARNSALRTWREAKAKLDIGGVKNFKPADEAQARDRYFETRAAAEAALAAIYASETALRRLLGLPVNDGTMLRPSDELVTAQFIPDWYACLAEGLTRRVELRRQKWNIKSLELQLKAAKSLTHPQLDFIAGYQVNALGDRLFASSDDDGITTQGFRSAYGTLTQGDYTGWDLGLQFSMPIGFREAHTQVQNIEWRLAKARDVLATQELEISHELGSAFQSLATQYVTAQSNFNRRRAAQQRVKLFEAEVRAGTLTLDLLLRAQASLADAEVAYFTSLVSYNQAITELHYRKGSLLEYDDVHLAEGDWNPEAYRQAYRRATARQHALDDPNLHTAPEELEQEAFDRRWEDPIEADFPAAQPLAPELDPAVPVPPEPEVEPSGTEPLKPEASDVVPGWHAAGKTAKRDDAMSGASTIQPAKFLEPAER